MWHIHMPEPNHDAELTDEQWKDLFAGDIVAAIARWVNRYTEKPPTAREFSNLFGPYKIPRNCTDIYLPPGGHAIEGALQPSLVRFPKDPLCEHLIVNHGLANLGTKEAPFTHSLEHTDDMISRLHPVHHKHEGG